MGFKLSKVFSGVKKAVSNPLTYVAPITMLTGGQQALDTVKGAYKVPQVPGASGPEDALRAQQQAALAQYQQLLGRQTSDYSQQQGLNKSLSGFYNPDGSLNQDAVNAYRQQVQQSDAQSGAVNNQAYNYLTNNSAVDDAERNRYLAALNGTGPISVGLQQDEAKAYKNFVAQQARLGNKVTGTGFGDASSSNSTAANQALSQMRQDYARQEDDQRNAAIQQGASINANRLGFYAGQRSAPGQMSLGFANNAYSNAPLQIGQGYGSIAGGYQNAYQPYTQDRENQYNQKLAQQQQNRGMIQDALGFGGLLFGR